MVYGVFMEKSNCLHCLDELSYRPSQQKGKYCSNKCQVDYQYDEYIRNWKEGKITGTSGYSVSNHISRYIREKYDHKCSRCNWNEINEYTNNIPLELEHIDGNHKNNREDNLTLLCPNCHSLTKTYKGANRGNGRHQRRKRYTDGNSY